MPWMVARAARRSLERTGHGPIGRPPLQSPGPETPASARGVVVLINEELGLRITDVVTAPGPVADPGG
jgi:hypothetical protein